MKFAALQKLQLMLQRFVSSREAICGELREIEAMGFRG
jgi:hypothetical protein